jgi:hypothetical protein
MALIHGDELTRVLVRLETISPQLFALNTTNGTIGNPLVGHAVIDDTNRKSAPRISENANAGYRLASGPTPDMLQTISREICPANSDRVFQETHEQFYRV